MATATRNQLKTDDFIFIIKNWEKMSVDELSKKFDVAATTITNTAAKIRKESDGKYCKANRFKSIDGIRAAIKGVEAE